jgi:hypothetical protein
MDEAATHKLYNVCTGISSSPKYEPRVTPGKGEYGKREQEPEQKATDQIYSDFGEEYPTQSELIKELENTQKRNMVEKGKTINKKIRQETKRIAVKYPTKKI